MDLNSLIMMQLQYALRLSSHIREAATGLSDGCTLTIEFGGTFGSVTYTDEEVKLCMAHLAALGELP